VSVLAHLTSTLAVAPTLGPEWLQPENILERFGAWAFWAVVVIIFVECGLLMFFLPGDSLLFVTGLFIGAGTIDVNIWVACILLTIAAIAGNVSGYWIGRKTGPALFKNPDAKFLTPANVDKTHAFFEKYGPRSIILARFVPIVRTFITLMAGVGRMDFKQYLLYSSIGGVIWGGGVTLLGYFLGDVPFVEKNIEVIAILIVVLSLLPAAFEWWHARRIAKEMGSGQAEQPAADDAV
jgi:membrane-associated protein